MIDDFDDFDEEDNLPDWIAFYPDDWDITPIEFDNPEI